MGGAPSRWLRLAEGSLGAGEVLRDSGELRSAISRLYYSTYQAAHAIIATTPKWDDRPRRGNWQHEALANSVYATLKTELRKPKAAAGQLHAMFQLAMNARVMADYMPMVEPDDLTAKETWRAASVFVSLARQQVG
jgi:uncharacterized protein (UPF0332 family)